MSGADSGDGGQIRRMGMGEFRIHFERCVDGFEGGVKGRDELKNTLRFLY